MIPETSCHYSDMTEVPFILCVFYYSWWPCWYWWRYMLCGCWHWNTFGWYSLVTLILMTLLTIWSDMCQRWLAEADIDIMRVVPTKFSYSLLRWYSNCDIDDHCIPDVLFIHGILCNLIHWWYGTFHWCIVQINSYDTDEEGWLMPIWLPDLLLIPVQFGIGDLMPSTVMFIMFSDGSDDPSVGIVPVFCLAGELTRCGNSLTLQYCLIYGEYVVPSSDDCDYLYSSVVQTLWWRGDAFVRLIDLERCSACDVVSRRYLYFLQWLFWRIEWPDDLWPLRKWHSVLSTMLLLMTWLLRWCIQYLSLMMTSFVDTDGDAAYVFLWKHFDIFFLNVISLFWCHFVVWYIRYCQC